MVLLAKGITDSGISVYSTTLRILDQLIADVVRLPQSAARDKWLARLGEWQTWCSEFGRAPVTSRVELLRSAEARFQSQTGCEPRRGQGQMYSDRLIFYEEA